jgi:hypothetical protein
MIEKKKEINALISKINERDKNWEWKVPVIKDNEFHMWWEYLKYLKCKIEHFRIVWDEECEWFEVYDHENQNVTEDIEFNGTIESVMYSVLYYASSRY